MIAHQVIKTIRYGNAVTRWHTRPMHKYETVGEHTANVLSIVFALCGDHTPSAKLIGATVLHDTAEQWTGDIPATAKWDSPELKKAADELENKQMLENFITTPELSEDEALTLKWADMLDLLYRCLDELSMGNRNIADVFEKGVKYLQGLPAHKIGLKLLEELIKERRYVG